MFRASTPDLSRLSNASLSLASREKRAPSFWRALACHSASTAGASRCRRDSWRSSVCRRLVSAEMATLAGSLEGVGGARKVEVRGLGAKDLAGL